MARKNNSKQTIENIISVSAKLFVEKGYENTSMQEIVDALGMSKGAIFHHFESKEDIFNAVVNKQNEYTEQAINNWLREAAELSGKEKLMTLLEKNLNDQQMRFLDGVLSAQIQTPHFIAAYMRDSVNKSAPYFAKIMREGKEDGSITTDFPDQCAEVFFLLINIWCDPMIFMCDAERLKMRFKFLQQMMIKMGADIISDELIEEYLKFFEKLYEEKNEMNHGVAITEIIN